MSVYSSGPKIPLEVLLLIVAHADRSTISNIMATCPLARDIVSAYEKSIFKHKTAGLNPHLSLPASHGTALSSATHERELLRPHTFDVIQELDLRTRRIDALLDGNSVLAQAIQNTTSFHQLPPSEHAALLEGLKRACALTDRLGDCVAEAMIKAAAERPDDNSDDTTPPPPPSPPSPPTRTHAQRCHTDIMTAVHRARLEFITGPAVAPLDLAYLHLLSTIAGIAYAKVHGDLVAADPLAWERVLAFEEVVLREGTMALWAFFRPSTSLVVDHGGGGGGISTPSLTSLYPPLFTTTTTTEETQGEEEEGQIAQQNKGNHTSGTTPTAAKSTAAVAARLTGHVKSLVSLAMDDIFEWETGGPGALPGLLMSVKHAFADKSGGREPVRASIEMDVAMINDITRKARGGDQRERRQEASSSPPSLGQGHDAKRVNGG